MPTTMAEDKDLAKLLLENIDIMIDGNTILEWVAANFRPNEVFSDRELSEWAEANGYVKA